jgi:hypothetical protein
VPVEPLGGCQKLPHPAKKGVTASSSRANFPIFIVTPQSPISGPFISAGILSLDSCCTWIQE